MRTGERPIEWLGTRRVKLASLRKPGDWDARLKSDHVTRLAASLGVTAGPIQLPVVLADTYEIVAGADRLAAHQLAGREDAEVRMLRASPAGMLVVRAAENAVRRQDATQWAPVLVDAMAQLEREQAAQAQVDEQLGPEEDEPPEIAGRRDRKSPGRPKTERGQAREAAATVTGRSAEAIRSAEKRGRAKERPPAPKAAKIETWGCDVPLVVSLAVEAAAAAGREVEAAYRALGRSYLGLEGNVGTADIQELHRLHQELGDHLRRLVPAALCPWCKGAEGLRQGLGYNCTGCGGVGWVGKERMSGAPERLRQTGAKAEVQFTQRKKLRIELPSGEVYEPEADEAF